MLCWEPREPWTGWQKGAWWTLKSWDPNQQTGSPQASQCWHAALGFPKAEKITPPNTLPSVRRGLGSDDKTPVMQMWRLESRSPDPHRTQCGRTCLQSHCFCIEIGDRGRNLWKLVGQLAQTQQHHFWVYIQKMLNPYHKDSTMFIAALFVIARNWKQPKCPLTEEWMKKML